ncbi:MAG: nucleotide exchange factor GrpE [Lentilactobacillus buchneri]|nr:nucleotide exchange factor GrpE [Lentilactobacillus buchneri]MCI1950412.1 nucleotide exchange factor GrpE [Lentilactobacillus buchneri]MCI2018561.1 nucleotide exchange factor GrpE [Lentilactobacillus buchneri]MCI2027628.1 nucleotide exchange factor GrpE [Lentilactobacillus buchneri]
MADKKDDSLKSNEPADDLASKNDHGHEKKVQDAKAAKKSDSSKTEKHDSADEVVKLKQTVVNLQKKLDDMENRYLRAEADIRNIQTHAKKEQADLIKYDGQQLAHDILPIVDNLQRALAVEATDENGKQLKKGVSMVFEHLTKALSDNGVEEIDALNKPFDPKLQQAIQTTTADEKHPADTVAQVLQSGYRLKDRVLRPAMVVVAK